MKGRDDGATKTTPKLIGVAFGLEGEGNRGLYERVAGKFAAGHEVGIVGLGGFLTVLVEKSEPPPPKQLGRFGTLLNRMFGILQEPALVRGVNSERLLKFGHSVKKLLDNG